MELLWEQVALVGTIGMGKLTGIFACAQLGSFFYEGVRHDC